MSAADRTNPYARLAERLRLRAAWDVANYSDLPYLCESWRVFGPHHATAELLSAQALDALTAARILGMDPTAWAEWAFSLVSAPGTPVAV